MAGRFDYVKYDDAAMAEQAEIKKVFQVMEQYIDLLVDGRHKSLAFTKLEETYMWIGKALRDEQIIRNGSAPLQEERKEG